MSLLALEGVGKRRSGGGEEGWLLRDATLELQAGEVGVVWGMREVGKTTLIRLAAGIEAPEQGTVRFDGQDLAEHGERLLGGDIAYCRKSLSVAGAHRREGTVEEELVVGPLTRGLTRAGAHTRAREALRRAGASHLANRHLTRLDTAETVRVALARALTPRPRLLVVDEPVKGVELGERDGILLLLRGLADEGVAVLACAGETTALGGADRAWTLGGGELRGGPSWQRANVLPLRTASGAGAAGAG